MFYNQARSSFLLDTTRSIKKTEFKLQGLRLISQYIKMFQQAITTKNILIDGFILF